jgi:GNAT superfamily N-acetyltransferase
VNRDLGGGIELDDDKARVDVDAVHDYLANHSYWAAGRPRDEVVRHLEEAARVLGLYAGARQVGYARVEIQGDVVYLADVYVLPEARGRGLGVELVREAVENGEQASMPWRLRSADAHSLYERFGFTRVDDRIMERPAR